ncbi:MAG: hypothetical protein ACLFRV_11635 [Acidimicrobiales bacterium]
MDEHRAQLSSVSSTLAELTQRVVAIADAHRDTETDDISTDLDEVERALRSAYRRLDRLVHRLR